MRSTDRARSLTFAARAGAGIALLCFAALVAAQAPQWKSFGSATEGFRAQFPSEPQASRNSVPVAGQNFELRSYEADAGSTSLYVGVCDYGQKGQAADPAQMLDSAKKGVVDHMGAHILSEKRISLQAASGPSGASVSNPGIEFQAENDKLHFTMRMYMASGVLYQAMVATPLGDKFADTARFLDSFELLPPDRPATPAAPAVASDWKPYRFADDGFSVSFPSQPEVQKQSITTEAGPVELRTYAVESPSGAFITAVCDYGAGAAGKDPDVLLEDAQKGAVDNVKGHLTSEKKITFGAYHGIEFEADSDSAHVSARIYLVGTTLYQMIVASPLTAKPVDTGRFLDSFQLIPPRSAE